MYEKLKESNIVQMSVGDKAYRINLLKVGQEFCRPDKKHEGLVREFYSLHFVLDGHGTLCVNDRKFVLGKGTAFLLRRGERYDYYPDVLKPWSYIWINFIGADEDEDVDDFLAQCGFTKERHYVILNDHAQTAQLFIQLHDGYDGGILQNMRCAGNFLLIAAQLIAERNKYAPISVRGSLSDKYFNDILTYIHGNYRLNLSIKQIADDMNVSEKQMYGMFKKFLDMTPIDYINRYRISNACVFLKQMDRSVESVAEMVGIDNPKYFTRMFVKWKGIPPREYKKQSGDDDPFAWMSEKNINYR